MRLGDWAGAQAAVLRGDADVLPPFASTAEPARHCGFTQAVGRNEFGMFPARIRWHVSRRRASTP